MTDKARVNRLEALAAFAPRFADPGASVGEWHPMTGSGTAEDPYTLPWFSLSELGEEFVAMLYRDGWMLEGFDWSSWAHGPEGQLIANDRTVLAKANPEQIAKLLTALVRQERFVEGALNNAWDSGLLLAIAKRARKLCRTEKAP